MKKGTLVGGAPGEARAGRVVGLLVVLVPLGLLVLAFSECLKVHDAPWINAAVLLGSMLVILSGCELFTNSVEHVGRIYDLSHQATGGLLAAVGTALPESSIPVIAVFFGSPAHGEAVGVGAILGAPFLLVTLALALLGLTVAVAWLSGRRESPRLDVDGKALILDFRVFLCCFAGILVVSLLDLSWLKKVGAVALLCTYVWYVKFSLGLDGMEGEKYTKVLYLERFGGMPRSSSTVALQLAGGLVTIVAGAKLFVSAVITLALYFKAPALLLSLILAPLATELPEKYNSVVWALRGQDTLAVSNITGAMVFQSMIPVAFGFVFTRWSLGTTELLNILMALAAGGFIYYSLSRLGSLKAKALLAVGLLYLAYMVRAIWIL
jgi:cation:H+ antiporter